MAGAINYILLYKRQKKGEKIKKKRKKERKNEKREKYLENNYRILLINIFNYGTGRCRYVTKSCDECDPPRESIKLTLRPVYTGSFMTTTVFRLRKKN